jgi:Family of unknown function (DUF6527)
MKLVELEPRYVALETGGPCVGLSFDCPHCKVVRLAVLFHHAGREVMDDAYILAHSPGTNHIWSESGEDFTNITLSPSVDASESGHWHGFITNGEVSNA